MKKIFSIFIIITFLGTGSWVRPIASSNAKMTATISLAPTKSKTYSIIWERSFEQLNAIAPGDKFLAVSNGEGIETVELTTGKTIKLYKNSLQKNSWVYCLKVVGNRIYNITYDSIGLVETDSEKGYNIFINEGLDDIFISEDKIITLDGGVITRLNPDGKIAWIFDNQTGLYSLACWKDKVYAVDYNNRLLTVSANDGKLLRHDSLETDNNVRIGYAFNNKKAYFYGTKGLKTSVQYFNLETIERKYRRTIDGPEAMSLTLIADHVIAACADGHLRCFVTDFFTPLWTVKTNNSINAKPALLGDRLFFGSGNTVLGYDIRGNNICTLDLGAQVKELHADSDKLFATTNDGRVVCIGIDSVVGANPRKVEFGLVADRTTKRIVKVTNNSSVAKNITLTVDGSFTFTTTSDKTSNQLLISIGLDNAKIKKGNNTATLKISGSGTNISVSLSCFYISKDNWFVPRIDNENDDYTVSQVYNYPLKSPEFEEAWSTKDNEYKWTYKDGWFLAKSWSTIDLINPTTGDIAKSYPLPSKDGTAIFTTKYLVTYSYYNVSCIALDGFYQKWSYSLGHYEITSAYATEEHLCVLTENGIFTVFNIHTGAKIASINENSQWKVEHENIHIGSNTGPKIKCNGKYYLFPTPNLTLVDCKTLKVFRTLGIKINKSSIHYDFFGDRVAFKDLNEKSITGGRWVVLEPITEKKVFSLDSTWITYGARIVYSQNNGVCCIDSQNLKTIWKIQGDFNAFKRLNVVGQYLFASFPGSMVVDLKTGKSVSDNNNGTSTIDFSNVLAVGAGKVLLTDRNNVKCYNALEGVIPSSRSINFGGNLKSSNFFLSNYTTTKQTVTISFSTGILSTAQKSFVLAPGIAKEITVLLDRSKLKLGSNTFSMTIISDFSKNSYNISAWLNDEYPVWPTSRGFEHGLTSNKTSIIPEKLSKLWSIGFVKKTKSENPSDLGLNCIIAQGMVYYQIERKIYAHNVSSGKLIWSRNLSEFYDYNVSFVWIDGMVVCYQYNKIVVIRGLDGTIVNNRSGMNDFFTMNSLVYSNGKCMTFPDFKTIWKNDKLNANQRCFGDGKIFVYDKNTVTCIDGNTGKQLWQSVGLSNKPNSRQPRSIAYSAGVVLLDYSYEYWTDTESENILKIGFDGSNGKRIWESKLYGSIVSGANGYFQLLRTESREILLQPDISSYTSTPYTSIFIGAYTGKEITNWKDENPYYKCYARDKVYSISDKLTWVSLKDPKIKGSNTEVSGYGLCCAGGKIFVLSDNGITCFSSDEGLKCDKEQVDFGLIKTNEKKEITLKLENLGKQKIIAEVTSSEIFFVPDVQGIEVDGSKTSELKMTIDTTKYHGTSNVGLVGTVSFGWGTLKKEITLYGFVTDFLKGIHQEWEQLDQAKVLEPDFKIETKFDKSRVMKAGKFDGACLTKDGIIRMGKEGVENIDVVTLKSRFLTKTPVEDVGFMYPDNAGNIYVTSKKSNLLRKIEQTTGKVLWRFEFRKGEENINVYNWDYVIPSNGKVYVANQNEFVVIDESTGKKLWSYSISKNSVANGNDCSIGLPCFDNKNIYLSLVYSVYNNNCALVCLDEVDGKQKWITEKNLTNTGGGTIQTPMPSTSWYAGKTFIWGEKVFFQLESDFVWENNYFFHCLEKKTGKIIYELPLCVDSLPVSNGFLRLKHYTNDQDVVLYDMNSGKKVTFLENDGSSSRFGKLGVKETGSNSYPCLFDLEMNTQLSSPCFEHGNDNTKEYKYFVLSNTIFLSIHSVVESQNVNRITVFKQAPKKLEFTIGSPSMKIDGSVLPMGLAPELVRGKVYLPAKFVIEPVGGFAEASGTPNGICLQLDDTIYYFNIGSSKYFFYQNSIKIIKEIDPKDPSVTPFINNGRTYMPLRFISDLFGFSASYDDKTKKIIVDATFK